MMYLAFQREPHCLWARLKLDDYRSDDVLSALRTTGLDQRPAYVTPNRDILGRIADLVAKSGIRIPVDSSLALDHIESQIRTRCRAVAEEVIASCT